MYILGIEGGATNTVCVILNGDCQVLGRSSGSGSNQYLIGIPAVAALIADLARQALLSAGLPAPPSEGSAQPVFVALGACMSGFLEKGVQESLEALFRKDYPWLASHYYIDNDSPGSIYTAAGDAGGCVLIAGTGSMGQFMAPSGSTVNCGGHGHMFGDEGSAYSIASSAIRLVFAALDGYDVNEPSFYDPSAPEGDPRSPYKDTTLLRSAMLSYFELSEPSGMLDVMYGAGFKKDRVAGFAKEVARLAGEGDASSTVLMGKAGRELGANLRALVAGAVRAGHTIPSTLSIVCVGSVWKSWALLKPAFVRAARAGGEEGNALRSFQLVTLTETSAVGAAWKAGLQAGISLALNSTLFTTTLHIDNM